MENKIYHEIINVSDAEPMLVTILDNLMPQYMVLEHWHRSMEINYLLKCSSDFWINGEKKEVQRGDIVLVNSGDIHAIIPHKEGNQEVVICTIISYDFLKSIYPQIDGVRFNFDKNPDKLDEMKDTYVRIMELKQRGQQEFSYMEQNSLTFHVLYLLFTYFLEEKDQVAYVKSQKYMVWIKEIMNYIKDHYQESLTQKQVADHFGVSREYFARVFSKYTGTTFKEYLDKVRMEKAFKELLESDYSMMEIAMRNGFPDVRAFNSLFRKSFHMTPLQYKKNGRTTKDDGQLEMSSEKPHIILYDM